MKSRERITLKNPLMFSIIMQDRNRCIGLLERIFSGRKVQELNFVCQEDRNQAEPEVERTYIVGTDVKAIRMDVLFEDSRAWYDIDYADPRYRQSAAAQQVLSCRENRRFP